MTEKVTFQEVLCSEIIAGWHNIKYHIFCFVIGFISFLAHQQTLFVLFTMYKCPLTLLLGKFLFSFMKTCQHFSIKLQNKYVQSHVVWVCNDSASSDAYILLLQIKLFNIYPLYIILIRWYLLLHVYFHVYFWSDFPHLSLHPWKNAIKLEFKNKIINKNINDLDYWFF